MHYKFIQTLTIILALLAFTGQSTAMVDMPCADLHEQPSHQATDTMDHSMHSMEHGAISDSTEGTIDCCDDSGSCNMTTCSSFALIVEPQVNSQVSQHNSSIDLYSNKVIASYSSSVYRPPISY